MQRPRSSRPRTAGDTSTRYLGFCPCCGRTWKVVRGVLAHHGYQRPGNGTIFNDCHGAQRVPHEISRELADEFLELLHAQFATTKSKLKALARCRRLNKQRRVGLETVTVELVKGECEAWEWQQAYATCKAHLDGEIRVLSSEIQRVEGYLVDWKPKRLRSVEEELSATRDERAARREATLQRHREAFSKAIGNVQKRIDSALRTKNSRTLAEIWEEAPRRLRDQHPPEGATRATLLAAIDRDHVWEAFGLAGDVPQWRDREHPVRQILERMRHRNDRLEGGYRREPWGDGWRPYMERMTLEWPAVLGGETPKGAATLAELQERLRKPRS